MRKLFIILTLAIIILSSNSFAYQCGFKPAKPMYCFKGDYICQCSNYGSCQWVLQGC